MRRARTLRPGWCGLARTCLPVYTFGMTARPDLLVEFTETVWKGRTQLDVVRFRNRRFDGAMSDVRTWEVWLRGHAVGVLPYDPVDRLPRDDRAVPLPRHARRCGPA